MKRRDFLKLIGVAAVTPAALAAAPKAPGDSFPRVFKNSTLRLRADSVVYTRTSGGSPTDSDCVYSIRVKQEMSG